MVSSSLIQRTSELTNQPTNEPMEK